MSAVEALRPWGYIGNSSPSSHVPEKVQECMRLEGSGARKGYLSQSNRMVRSVQEQLRGQGSHDHTHCLYLPIPVQC